MASNSIHDLINRSIQAGSTTSISSISKMVVHSPYYTNESIGSAESRAIANKFNLPEPRTSQSDIEAMQVTAIHEAGHWAGSLEGGKVPLDYRIGGNTGGYVSARVNLDPAARISFTLGGPVSESAFTTGKFQLNRGMSRDLLDTVTTLHPELAERADTLYSQWNKMNPNAQELGQRPPAFLSQMITREHLNEVTNLGQQLVNELAGNEGRMQAIGSMAQSMYNTPSISSGVIPESLRNVSREYAPNLGQQLDTMPVLMGRMMPMQSNLSASNLTPLGILNQLTGAVPFGQRGDWSSSFGQGINSLARTGGLNDVANSLVQGQSFQAGVNAQTQVGNFTIGARPELLSTQQGGDQTAWNIMFSSAGGKTGSAAFKALSSEEQQRARIAGEAQRQATGASFSGALMFDKDAFQKNLISQGYVQNAREAKQWMAGISGQNPNDVAQIMRSQGVFAGATYFPANPDILNEAVGNADVINQAVNQGLAVASPNDPSGIVQQMGINANVGNPIAEQAMNLLGVNPQSAATGGLYNPAVRQQLAGQSQARLAYLNSTYGNQGSGVGGMGQPPIGSSSGNPPPPTGPLPPSGPNAYGRRIESQIDRGNLNYNPERISGIIDNLSEKFEKLSKTTEGVTTSQAESIQKIATTWSQVSGPIADLQKAAKGGSSVAQGILDQIGGNRIQGLSGIEAGLMDTSSGTSLMQAGFQGGATRDWGQSSLLRRFGALMQPGAAGRGAMSEMESQGLLEGAGGGALKGAAALGRGLEGLVQMHYAYRNIGRMFIDPVEQAAQQYGQMQVQNYQGLAQAGMMGQAAMFGAGTQGYQYANAMPLAMERNQLALGRSAQSAYGGIISSGVGGLAAQAQGNLGPAIGAGLAATFALTQMGAPEVAAPVGLAVGGGVAALGMLGNVTSYDKDIGRQTLLAQAQAGAGNNFFGQLGAAARTDLWGAVNQGFGNMLDVVRGRGFGATTGAQADLYRDTRSLMAGTPTVGRITSDQVSRVQSLGWSDIAGQYGMNPDEMNPEYQSAFSSVYGIMGQKNMRQIPGLAQRFYEYGRAGGNLAALPQTIQGIASGMSGRQFGMQNQFTQAALQGLSTDPNQAMIQSQAGQMTAGLQSQAAMFGYDVPINQADLQRALSQGGASATRAMQVISGQQTGYGLAAQYSAFTPQANGVISNQFTDVINNLSGTAAGQASVPAFLARAGSFGAISQLGQAFGYADNQGLGMRAVRAGIGRNQSLVDQLSTSGLQAGVDLSSEELGQGADLMAQGIDPMARAARTARIRNVSTTSSQFGQIVRDSMTQKPSSVSWEAWNAMSPQEKTRTQNQFDIQQGRQVGFTEQFAPYGGLSSANQAAMVAGTNITDPNQYSRFSALAGGNQIAWSQAIDAGGGPQWMRQVQTGSQGGTVGMQAGYDENISAAQSQQLMGRAVAQGFVRGDGRLSTAQIGSMNQVQRQIAMNGLQIEERNYGFALENRQMARQISSVMTERGFEDTGIALGRSQQDWARNIQGQQIGLQGQQLQYNYQFQGQQLQIGRQHEIVQQQWQDQNLAYQRNVNELQYGFSQIDSAEEVRYSTGRQRRTAMRHQEQATVMFSVQEGQQTKEEERQKTREKWSEDQFNRDKQHFEVSYQFEQKNFELTRENFQKEGEFIKQQRALEDAERAYRRHIQDLDLEDAKNKLAFEQTIKKTMDDLNGATTVWNTQATEASSKLSYMATTGQLLGPALDAATAAMQRMIQAANSMSGTVYSGPTTTSTVNISGSYNPGSSLPSGTAFDLGGYTGLPGYADGGYTGLARKNLAKGVVHGGEWVVPQHGSLVSHNPMLEELLGKIHSELQSIHADGGNAIIQIHNNNPDRAMREGKTLYERAYSQ